ncbi:hypothetical protein DL96DRAFT_1818444 [Flagelloscypha sp. PMI_526]|nr:hypothetical protein DL96DRAFT_1818444 [Flagelloscypha sp. PMI_526]
MNAFTTLPDEILEDIFAYFEIDRNDPFSSHLQRSLPQFFVGQDKTDITPSAEFADILRASPRIGGYVKYLSLYAGALSDKPTSVVVTMLSSVQTLIIVPSHRNPEEDTSELYDWNTLEIRESLAKRVFPMISSLYVRGFHIFPFHEVIPLCSRLKSLTTVENGYSGHFDSLMDIVLSRPFPPLRELVCNSSNSGQTLLCVIRQTSSTLKVLRLQNRLSSVRVSDMVYEREILHLIGANLTTLDLSSSFFDPNIQPRWNSDLFHLRHLPSLQVIEFGAPSPFSERMEVLLNWVLPRLSLERSDIHPLTTFRVVFFPIYEPTEPISQAVSELWLHLDDTLASFTKLDQVQLLSLLDPENREAVEVWDRQQVSLKALFPIIAGRNNVLAIDREY